MDAEKLIFLQGYNDLLRKQIIFILKETKFKITFLNENARYL